MSSFIFRLVAWRL